jgi:regulator of protease activity HflC (stomatin/prohibitin superfamily)
MGWIIWSVLLLFVAWGGIAAWMYGKRVNKEYEARMEVYRANPGQYREPSKSPIPYVGIGLGTIGVAAVLWLLITGFSMVKSVGEREVGIVYNFTGTIAGKEEKGWVTIAPWQHMEKENVAIQHLEFIFGEDNSAVSKDQQDIFARLAVNYQIDSANVLDLYRRVGPSWETTIVESRVPQVFKEVTSTFNTPRITEERVALREQTRERLTEELAPYDIKVVDVFITNLGFSDLYSQAIEQKQKQVQDALQAEAKVKQIEAEARQKIAAAKGEATSNVERARGDAVSNRLRQRSLTPALIQWEAIQKLNPKVTLIICPPRTVCIPNTNVVPEP